MAETKQKQYSSTAVRIYAYTAAAVPVRTQGNGTPPGKCEEVYTYVYYLL